MKYLTPILLLLFSILSIVGGSMMYDHMNVFSKVKTAADCSDKSKLPASCQNDPKCCAIWHNGQCLKGEVDGDTCVSKSNALVLLIYLLALCLFVAFIITLIMKIRSN